MKVIEKVLLLIVLVSSLSLATAIKTYKTNYSTGSSVWIKLENTPSNEQDWVGIYPVGTDNSWKNVVQWKWTKNPSPAIDLGDWYKFENLADGDYEARLFYNNSFHVETKVGLIVGNNVNNNVYGSEGPYIKDVTLLKKKDYFAYYPKNNIEGAPLVLISGFQSLVKYTGLMKYLASQGCYVVAHADRVDKEGWSDPFPRIKHFEKAILDVKRLGVDTSRLITMGSSAGAMVSYKIMKHFRNQGYGSTKSFIIDIEGYYAISMKKNDLNSLDSASLILQLGGYTGVQYNKFSEDSRTLLSLSTILNNNVDKSFIVLNSKNHYYARGKYAEIIKRKDLLIPIDAMLKYEFFNENGQYNNAEAILFDNYDQTVQRVYDDTMDVIGNKGDWNNGYNYPCVNPYSHGSRFESTIDYCNDHGL